MKAQRISCPKMQNIRKMKTTPTVSPMSSKPWIRKIAKMTLQLNATQKFAIVDCLRLMENKSDHAKLSICLIFETQRNAIIGEINMKLEIIGIDISQQASFRCVSFRIGNARRKSPIVTGISVAIIPLKKNLSLLKFVTLSISIVSLSQTTVFDCDKFEVISR